MPAFDAPYEDSVFITLWGSLAVPHETGRRLMYVPTSELTARAGDTALDLARGFGHPIDLLTNANGLLVLDYDAGVVIRIRQDQIAIRASQTSVLISPASLISSWATPPAAWRHPQPLHTRQDGAFAGDVHIQP